MRFEVFGEEFHIKEVKVHGTGGVVYVPRSWEGEKIALVRNVKTGIEDAKIKTIQTKPVVYGYYTIDPLHRAHLSQMMSAKAIAGSDGVSIAGILSEKAILEKKPAPILSLEERMFIASSIRYNDMVVLQDEYSPLINIKSLQPDVLMESTSHTKEDVAEAKKYMDSINGRVIVTPYYKYQSSTQYKNKVRGKK